MSQPPERPGARYRFAKITWENKTQTDLFGIVPMTSDGNIDFASIQYMNLDEARGLMEEMRWFLDGPEGPELTITMDAAPDS